MKFRSLAPSLLISGAALLASSAAHARPISIDFFQSDIFSYDGADLDPNVTDSLTGSGPYTHSVSTGDSLATSSAGASGFSALAESYGVPNQTAYVSDHIRFTPDATGPLGIDWDFSGDPTHNSFMSIDEVGGGNLFTAGFGSSGSTSVLLNAGTQYEFFGTALSKDGNPASWWNIPTPGIAALLGLGGLIAARRRRD